MFSLTFKWECHEHLWDGCEKTFPSGTCIHRLHIGETCHLSVTPSSNECLVMSQPPKYLNLTTSLHLWHAARSRTMLSRPSFGYSAQPSELAPIGKWHFQYPPSSNVSSHNDRAQNHKPTCRCHPHRHRDPWAGWPYQSPEHDEADSIDNTAHTPMSVDSEEEWDCSSIVFLAPSAQCGWGIPSITVQIFDRTIFQIESYPMQPRVSVGSRIDNIYPVSDGWEAVDGIDPTEQRGCITILLQYRHQLLTIHAE